MYIKIILYLTVFPVTFRSLIHAVFKSIVRTFYKFTYFIHAFFIRRMELIPDDPEFKKSDQFSVVETRDVVTSPLYSADELSFVSIKYIVKPDCV